MAATPPGPPGTVVGLWESPALNLALPGGFPWDSRGGCVVWGVRVGMGLECCWVLCPCQRPWEGRTRDQCEGLR